MSEPEARSTGDLLFALITILIGVGVIWGLWNQPKAPYDPVGAAAIPIWTAVSVIGLALILLARIALRRSTRGDAVSYFLISDDEDGMSGEPRFAAYSIGLSLLYAAALPFVGFLFASGGFIFALGWLLGDRSPRGAVIAAIIAIVGATGLDQGFRALLIDLP